MSRSYPIWHEVQNCSYKSSKSYGNRNYGKETIYVGSSANNSHEHCIIEHTKSKEWENNVQYMYFRTFVNDKKVAETKFTICNKGKANDKI